MNTRFFTGLFFIFTFLSEGVAQKYTLVWADNFNYTGVPDSTKWSYDIGGHGWGNNELQYYTKSIKNASVQKGKLVIEAIQEHWDDNNYTSARLVSKNKGDWKYGIIEVRAKLPDAVGTWPAIWMLPTINDRKMQWPDDGEIDIMEHVGHDKNIIHGSVHSKSFNHIIGTQRTGRINIKNVTKFHTYSIKWTPTQIEWFVDNVPYYKAVDDGEGKAGWPFFEPFHMILNVAVGGNWGGTKGVDAHRFPQRMEIDFVKVYQIKTNTDTTEIE